MFPRFIIMWFHYIIYLVYNDFVEKAIHNWLDDENQGVDFVNI